MNIKKSAEKNFPLPSEKSPQQIDIIKKILNRLVEVVNFLLNPQLKDEGQELSQQLRAESFVLSQLLEKELDDDRDDDEYVKIVNFLLNSQLKDEGQELSQQLSPNSPSQASEQEVDYYEYIEKQAQLFEENKEELLKKYNGQYVLFENNNILDFGNNRIDLAIRAYQKFGMKQLFIEKVVSASSKSEIAGNIWTPFPAKD
ncbi:MAG: DUF5678 domain-containing protein [Spirulina sp.]